jgi:hypothetical protein
MRLLRSEDSARDGGAVLELPQLFDLARAWYGSRLDPDWQPRTRDEAQRVLASVGLVGPFWQLP